MNPSAQQQLDRLAQLVAESPHNLVSQRDRGNVRAVHIDEAVALAETLPLTGGTEWIDLGTGGGLPGLVLALLAPETRWTLLDSVRKKADAVRAFAEQLELANVVVVAERAEVLAWDAAHRERYDGAISRALGRLDVAAELGRGFVKPSGRIMAVKGPGWRDELPALQRACGPLALTDVHSTDVPTAPRATSVVTMRPSGAAPSRYPRRNGVPPAKPLGGPGA